MKKVFIVYFDDQTAFVVIEESIEKALACLSPDRMQNVSRVDRIPYPVL